MRRGHPSGLERSPRAFCTSVRIEGVPVGSTSLLLALYSERKGYDGGETTSLFSKRLWACGYCGCVLDELIVRAAVTRVLYVRRN